MPDTFLGEHIHLYRPREVNDEGQPHKPLNCWCEPHPIEFGHNHNGNVLYVFNHHTPALWCCTKHSDDWILDYLVEDEIPGTGPFADDTILELVE